VTRQSLAALQHKIKQKPKAVLHATARNTTSNKSQTQYCTRWRATQHQTKAKSSTARDGACDGRAPRHKSGTETHAATRSRRVTINVLFVKLAKRWSEGKATARE
jgi:hypothetical protein